MVYMVHNHGGKAYKVCMALFVNTVQMVYMVHTVHMVHSCTLFTWFAQFTWFDCSSLTLFT